MIKEEFSSLTFFTFLAHQLRDLCRPKSTRIQVELVEFTAQLSSLLGGRSNDRSTNGNLLIPILTQSSFIGIGSLNKKREFRLSDTVNIDICFVTRNVVSDSNMCPRFGLDNGLGASAEQVLVWEIHGTFLIDAEVVRRFFVGWRCRFGCCKYLMDVTCGFL